MRLILAAIGILASCSAFAGTISVDNAFASDVTGQPIQTKLGEPFWMTVQFRGATPTNVSMSVQSLGRTLTSSAFFASSGPGQATYGPIVNSTDGPIDVQVRLGDANVSVKVTPAKTDTPIEFYAPKILQGGYRAELQFKPGQSSALTWYLPSLPSFGFQQVLSADYPNATQSGSDVLQTNRLSASAGFTVLCRSVRVDAATLSTVGFAALRNLPAEPKRYLKSETYIESGDSRVKSLVNANLPKNFSRSMSVYAAAKALFRGTVAKLRYSYTTGNKPSATQALKSGVGDCGGFSSVFVAACRQAGIPARPITGITVGTDQWHVWAEFYVPGFGWVPADGSYGDSIDPSGAFGAYFGVVPDLDQRVATAIGFDHSQSRVKLPMLQSPMAFTDAKKVAWVSSACSLEEIPQP